MKLATFDINSTGKRTIGVYHNGAYVDLVTLSGGLLPADMIEFLKGGEAIMDQARTLLVGVGGSAGQYVYAEDEITLQSPVPLPGKIVHTSCNFDSHLEELTTWNDPEWESHNWGDFHFEHPTGFLEAPSSVVPSGAGVEIPVFTRQLDYEIEIAIIIGKEAYKVGVEEAFDYVAGYTIFMGKSFKGSCPLGPWLVTLDELDDPHDLDMKLRVNGEVRQDANTAQMHYKTAELVSWWSHMGLYPGDVITSGSPPGVAAGMDKPRWLQPGDTVDATIAKLGTLTTRII